MNVASLELCKELYELSGWLMSDYSPIYSYTDEDSNFLCPAYDLGYLLRKLPVFATGEHAPLEITKFVNDQWELRYKHKTKVHTIEAAAKSPEDAAAKLAIELLKSGVLPSERSTAEGRELAQSTPEEGTV